MHPSIALQVAERELREENEQIPHEDRTPPPPFLHFAPRIHQKRRTMTGVLAGYFDQPAPPKPLPILPGVQELLARTAAPAMSEEELSRLEKERRKNEMAQTKRGRPTTIKTKKRDADRATGVVVANSKRTFNRSPTRSDSPLTDSKIVSEESTPPLTPMSSRSDFSLQDSHRFVNEKPKKKHQDVVPFTRVPLPLAKANSARTAKGTTLASSEPRTGPGRKRKASEMEMPLQRNRGDSTAAAAAAKNSTKPKTRPGWKGWVEIEGSPEPKPKLINLDFPVPTLEKRTRSGRVAPATSDPLVRARKSSTTKSSTRASTRASETPAPTTATTPHADVHLEGTILGNVLSEEPTAET